MLPCKVAAAAAAARKYIVYDDEKVQQRCSCYLLCFVPSRVGKTSAGCLMHVVLRLKHTYVKAANLNSRGDFFRSSKGGRERDMYIYI